MQEEIPDEVLEDVEGPKEKQEEVSERGREEEEKTEKDEQGSRIEELSVPKVRDPTDPIEINSSKRFSNMAIKDKKDTEMMSDQVFVKNDNAPP